MRSSDFTFSVGASLPHEVPSELSSGPFIFPIPPRKMLPTKSQIAKSGQTGGLKPAAATGMARETRLGSNAASASGDLDDAAPVATSLTARIKNSKQISAGKSWTPSRRSVETLAAQNTSHTYVAMGSNSEAAISRHQKAIREKDSLIKDYETLLDNLQREKDAAEGTVTSLRKDLQQEKRTNKLVQSENDNLKESLQVIAKDENGVPVTGRKKVEEKFKQDAADKARVQRLYDTEKGDHDELKTKHADLKKFAAEEHQETDRMKKEVDVLKSKQQTDAAKLKDVDETAAELARVQAELDQALEYMIAMNNGLEQIYTEIHDVDTAEDYLRLIRRDNAAARRRDSSADLNRNMSKKPQPQRQRDVSHASVEDELDGHSTGSISEGEGSDDNEEDGFDATTEEDRTITATNIFNPNPRDPDAIIELPDSLPQVRQASAPQLPTGINSTSGSSGANATANTQSNGSIPPPPRAQSIPRNPSVGSNYTQPASFDLLDQEILVNGLPVTLNYQPQIEPREPTFIDDGGGDPDELNYGDIEPPINGDLPQDADTEATHPEAPDAIPQTNRPEVQNNGTQTDRRLVEVREVEVQVPGPVRIVQVPTNVNIPVPFVPSWWKFAAVILAMLWALIASWHLGERQSWMDANIGGDRMLGYGGPRGGVGEFGLSGIGGVKWMERWLDISRGMNG